MKAFAHLKLKSKFLVAFGVLGITIIVLATTALTQLAAINDATRTIAEQRMAEQKKIGEIRLTIALLRLNTLQHINAGSPEQMQSVETEAMTLYSQLQSASDHLHLHLDNIELSSLKQHLNDVDDKLQQWRQERDVAIVASRNNDKAAAKEALNGNVKQRFSALQEALSELSEQSEHETSASVKDAAARYQAAWWLAIIISVVAVIVVIAMLNLLIITIRNPIVRINAIAHEIAGGNLTVQVDNNNLSNDEVGDLQRAFAQMQHSLRDLLSQIGDTVQRLSAATRQVNTVARQNSDGVKRQQDEVTQLATAMSEMVATVADVARNSVQTAHAAKSAKSETDAGEHEVALTVSNMKALLGEAQDANQVVQELEKDSASIGVVLDVIRNIADQTNLLALNAAIEAARAGEQGRGFAVVADEVRTLAQRTQHSTQEINKIIEVLQNRARQAAQVMEQSQSKTQQANQQAQAAGEALVNIDKAITHISDMTTQIASAAEEQNVVVEALNKNVVSISTIAEETAIGAKQTASACEELHQLAEQLSNTASKFRL